MSKIFPVSKFFPIIFVIRGSNKGKNRGFSLGMELAI
jgi:hypothetical protein